MPGAIVGGGPYGVLQAAGLLFFAFAGYARIATLGEEVRDPARTIPRAIPLAPRDHCRGLRCRRGWPCSRRSARTALAASRDPAGGRGPLRSAPPGPVPVVRVGAAVAASARCWR